ncbi:hypothetical protein QFC21_004878 [Naganishia friedmannii]|uniref:Uncharacterized protein n=1 Tax=Naganishia friedmannii TaxID=89922 RepID=A0ACC2VCU5_9TREE|nr:hypothetical protein QFC21_004878 [Naganishia friedmannii]
MLSVKDRALEAFKVGPIGDEVDYAFAAAAVAPVESSPGSEPSLSRTTRSSGYNTSRTITPESASAYLSDLFSLPSTRPFPPPLALRMLTHKSYRAAHLLGYGHSTRTGGGTSSTSAAAAAIESERNGSAPHNARLAFLGKRALVSYLMMFLHQQALVGAAPSTLSEQSTSPSSSALIPEASASSSSSRSATLTSLNLSAELGAEHAFEDKIAKLTHRTNLGRSVGQQWNLEQAMRWESNWPSADVEQNGSLTVQGETVNAVLGGTLMYFGSPAAHRLFHLQVLPHLSRQFQSPQIQEAIQVQRRVAAKQLDGGIVVP